MKEEVLIMTIDFGKDHFNAIHINNQLKLISSSGSMITINDPTDIKAHKESIDKSANLFAFLNINNP